jgi:NAD(P)-dependent dehydrogenase (short-subunit alcohol dehydrogenase family)
MPEVPAERRLEGQVAIVTGAGRGIGRAIAVALASHGAIVVGCARSEAQLDQTRSEAESRGGQFSGRVLDVTDAAAAQEMTRSVELLNGPVSVLINNAGVCEGLGWFHEVPADAWWRDVEVNLGGAVNCARAVVPGMIDLQRGRIVNIISGASFNPQSKWSAYCTSKAALHAFTENLALELAPFGISVFSMLPGLVHTGLLDSSVATGIPEVVELFSGWLDEHRDVPPDVPAEYAVRIAAGDADALSGRFLDSSEDLDEVIARATEIVVGGLYTVHAMR